MDVIVHAGNTEDDLTEEDYRDMLAELRDKFTFAQLSTVCGLRYSGAYWSKLDRGLSPFTREVRAELRRVHHIALLRPTAQEAVAGVPADAAVICIAHDDSSQVNRVILIGGQEDVSVFHNGSLPGWRLAPDGGVTEVTRAQERTNGTGCTNDTMLPIVAQRRRRLIRPVAVPAQEARRAALGVGWKDVIEAGLRMLESKHNAA